MARYKFYIVLYCTVWSNWWWSRQSLHLSNPSNVVQQRAGVDEWWQLVGGYLEARGVFQNRPGRLDCLPIRATWRIVDRRRTRVSYCFGASDRLERGCRAATCVRSSAGSEWRLSVVGLSPVPFSWVLFCIRSGTFILPWFLYAVWTLLYFMLPWSCTIKLLFSL